MRVDNYKLLIVKYNMKRLSIIILLGCLWLGSTALAQQSLTDTSGLSIRTQITYTQATPIGRLQPKALCFDFYTHPSDADTLKPLVITVFGGAFVAGSRTYEDMIAWCVQLARRGYSAATIDYRLLPPSQFTADNLIRTGYMAAQDVSTAIRYFKAHSAEFKIDTNRIFLLGNSAGSVAILHEIFMDENERPQATVEPERLPSLHAMGDSLLLSHTPDVAGAILLWGALFDTTMIDLDEQTPLCLIHGQNDKVLPITSGNAFSKKYFPVVYGSQSISNRLLSLGNHNYELHLFAQEGHAFYFKYMAMFQLDPTKFNLCLEKAIDFMKNVQLTINN